MGRAENKPAWWKTTLYILIGVSPFPLAVVLLPMAEGLTGFGVLSVPFTIGGAATYRAYRISKSRVARGLIVTLGLFYVLLILGAITVLVLRIVNGRFAL
jgi:hypothetical protein